MPIYEYQCIKCSNVQEQFLLMSKVHGLDKIDPKLRCDECSKLNVMKRVVSSSIQVKDPSRIRLNGDPKKEAEYEKRAKDPERARRNRRHKFGCDGISITQSPFYKKEKRIKAQGKNDVDKKEFIKAAARNPNAIKAAMKATKRNSD
jgi:putative FmdB family regulatory protein